MAGHPKVQVEKLPTQFINTKINSEIFTEFQKVCKQQNISMNIVIEAFARQYSKGRYELSKENILKWKDDVDETTILNTHINKDVYYLFKDRVKDNGFFVRHVLSAFIEEYGKNKLAIEFVKCD